VRVLPCGDRALLVEVASLDEVLGLDAALRADPLPGVAEVVPAARTVLLRLEPGADPGAVRTALGRVRAGAGQRADAGSVDVPVVYDGEDLEEVGWLTGLGAVGVVEAHTSAEWVVAFCGFAPGFGYLTGSDPRLHVPRRSSPRTRVPAGSVALAGEYAGVYPRPSPGGWQLLGRTDLAVWDIDRDPPALLQPGTRVRFVAVGP
jgi:KipI family sensor histidine kinase inhibitor